MRKTLPVLLFLVLSHSAFAERQETLPHTLSRSLDEYDYSTTPEGLEQRNAQLALELKAVAGPLKQPPRYVDSDSAYFGTTPFKEAQREILVKTLRSRRNQLSALGSGRQQQLTALKQALDLSESATQKCRGSTADCTLLEKAESDARTLLSKLTAELALQNQTVEVERNIIALQLEYLKRARYVVPGEVLRSQEASQRSTRRKIRQETPHWFIQEKYKEAERSRRQKELLDNTQKACKALADRNERGSTYKKQSVLFDNRLTAQRTRLDKIDNEFKPLRLKLHGLLAAVANGDELANRFDALHKELGQIRDQSIAKASLLDERSQDAADALLQAEKDLRLAQQDSPLGDHNELFDPCTSEGMNRKDALTQAQEWVARAQVSQEEQRVVLMKKRAEETVLRKALNQERLTQTTALWQQTLPQLSPEYQALIFTYDAAMVKRLLTNFHLLTRNAGLHFEKRLEQASVLPKTLASWTGVSTIIKALFWLLFIIWVGFFIHGGADDAVLAAWGWAKASRFLQQSLQAMHSFMKLVSVCLRPAVVLGTAWLSADYLGFQHPEVVFSYMLIEWIILYQVLRSVAHTLFVEPAWSAERAQPLVRALDRAPVLERTRETAALSYRSLHLVILYLVVQIAVLSSVEMLLGQNILYHLLAKLFQAALGLVAFLLVYWWRNYARSAYLDSGPKLFSETLNNTTNRIALTLATVPMALAIIVRAAIPWIQRNLSGTGIIRTLNVFFTRRRMEQAAKQRPVRNRLQSQPLDDEYKKHFHIRELTNERYLLTPIAPIQKVTSLYNTWRKDKREGSIAIVGEAGMGKSTLINQVVRALCIEESFGLDETQVLRSRPTKKISTVADVIQFLSQDVFGFEKLPTSLDELEQAILDDPTLVVVVDDAHHFFLKQMDGLEALNAFVHVVSVTCTNVFWITAFNAYSWFFIKNLKRSEPPFRHIVHLKPWTAVDVEGLILARNDQTPYKANFQDLVIDRSDELHTEYEVIKTKRSYFRLLGDIAGGNPSVALRYWLSSLRVEDSDSQCMRVGLYNPDPPKSLVNASDKVFFLLTCIAQHASLSVDELTQVLRQPRDTIHRLLSYCEENDFIHRRNNQVMLDFDCYRQIVQTLTMRSFIYFHDVEGDEL